jgi:hypothetical protein
MPITPYERTQAVMRVLIPVMLNIGAPLLDLAAMCDVVTTCHESMLPADQVMTLRGASVGESCSDAQE